MRVFDCFPFLNERELLDVRLHELETVVDVFVIVEGTRTFRGEPHRPQLPLHVAERRDVRYRTVTPPAAEPRVVEAFIRNSVTDALADAADDDIVLVSDLDEIPRAETVRRLVDGEVALPVAFDLAEFNMALDWRVPSDVRLNYLRPVALRAGQLARSTPHDERYAGITGPHLPDAGWHFSCLGGPRRLARKARVSCHAEYDRKPFTDRRYLAECVATGHDPADRFDCEPVEVDATYPVWLQENRERFAHLMRPR